MDHFAGLDVSVKDTSICIVDEAGRIVREVKVASEPNTLLAVLALSSELDDTHGSRDSKQAADCVAGAAGTYLSEIIPPLLTESTVTFSAAADADGIDAIATTKVPNARPMQILRFIVLPLPREKFL
jgi:hypothetical protein